MKPNKALLALVIGMGVIIVVGLGALAYGLVQRAATTSAGLFASGTGPDVTVQIPPGSSVASIDRSGDLLMVHVVDEEDRSTLLFIDPADGRIVRRIAFSTRPPAPPR
jgi:hypothetical protein